MSIPHRGSWTKMTVEAINHSVSNGPWAQQWKTTHHVVYPLNEGLDAVCQYHISNSSEPQVRYSNQYVISLASRHASCMEKWTKTRDQKWCDTRRDAIFICSVNRRPYQPPFNPIARATRKSHTRQVRYLFIWHAWWRHIAPYPYTSYGYTCQLQAWQLLDNFCCQHRVFMAQSWCCYNFLEGQWTPE